MAMSSLAAQLKKLETPQTALLAQHKHRPSFLFESKVAARYDRNTFYDIGLSGLEELKTLNPHFSNFHTTLFDPASKSLERAVETSEANEKLDFHIKNFLTLLSPYFLVTAAHRALEWLIQRYHIQDFNTDDLLFLILPYHETLLFAKMLQIIPLNEQTGKWHWLHPVKREGVPLSKTALLNRAAKDMGFLKFVCDMPTQAIKISGSKSASLGTLFAFYCTSVVGALEYSELITENHITALLPSLISALGSSLPDFTASGFLIIARLATKACLGEKILEVLFNKLSKVDHSILRSKTSLMLVLLSQNVRKKISFPEKGLRRLAESKWFLPSLVTFSKDKIHIVPLVSALLRTSLRLVIGGDEGMKTFVQNLLNDLVIDAADAKQIFKCLLEEFDKGACEENTVVWYSGLFRDLEKSFPQVFDDTVSLALNRKQSKEAAAVETLLGVNTSRNDIYERLVHPNEKIRVDTIMKISTDFEPDQLGWLRQPLLERFKDESASVVKALLKMPPKILDSLAQDVLVSNLIVAASNFHEHRGLLRKLTRELIVRAEESQSVQVFIALLPYIFKIAECKALEHVKTPPHFLFFEKATADCGDRQQLVWNLLNDPKLIPSFEDIHKAFKNTPFFKQKKELWSSTAFLLAFSIPDNPDQRVVKSAMDFLIAYLDNPKTSVEGTYEEIGPTNVDSHISSHGEMLIDKALHCLNVLTSKSIQKSVHDKASWWDFSKDSSSFILSIYKVILKGASSSKKAIRQSFSDTQQHFLKNYFEDDEARINFLLNALIYDPSLGDRNVAQVNSLLREDDGRVTTAVLSSDSLVIPAALVLLNSSDSAVRTGILEFLKSLSNSFSSGFYRTLIDIILEHQDELKIDAEQIIVIAYSVLSPSKEIQKMHLPAKRKAVKNIVDKLFDIATMEGTPLYIKTKLFEILEFVQSEELFNKTCSLAMQLIGNASSLQDDDAKLLTLVIRRFNETTIGVLKSDKAWEFMEMTLADQITKVHITPAKTTSPCGILINQITKEMFDSMPEPKSQNQQRFLSMVIEWVTDSENAHIVSSTASMFKKISLDSEIIVSLLSPMLTVDVKAPEGNKTANQPSQRRRSNTKIPALEVLETPEWKRGVCLLEMIQSKKKVNNVHILLPTLFDILKRSLQFEHQNAVEYHKQLLLSTILFCCEKLTESGSTSMKPDSLHVDLVVDCVRASHNPQTHHHALLALTYLAKIIPEQILHNIMAIFTFIGSSVLRQDDAYSFQIISQIIDTVVPVLLKGGKEADYEVNIASILRVFVSAFLDIPEHRRLPLLHKLMVTLNDGEHLWIFLALVFESHVTRPITDSDDIEIKENVGVVAVPKRLETSLELCAKFSPPVILNACHKLLVHMNELPHDKDRLEVQPMSKLATTIFNAKENTGKQLRHYKFTLLTFLSSLLSSSEFVIQMADQSNEVTEGLKDVFTSIVNQNLIYLKSVLHQVEATAQLPTAKFWKAILATTYEVLDKINALLPTDLFLKVVKNLLDSDLEAIRRKAMELLGWRLQDPRRPVLQETLFQLLTPFTAALNSITKSEELSHERQLTLQTSLFTLKLMARQLASVYIVEFKQVLTKVTDLVVNNEVSNWAVLGSLILCAGELISLLKSSAIAVLPQFVPVLIHHLKNLNLDEGGELLLISIITAIQKVVDSLANFLSPYLPQLLFQVCSLSAKHDNPVSETSKSPQLSAKLKAIRQKLSSEVPNRVLVPAVATCHSKFVKRGNYPAIGPLMSILSASFKSGADLTSELTSLFLKALQFRSDHSELPLDLVGEVESSVVSTILTLTLKLSEAGFKPLYSKFYEWANRAGQPERIITFYRLSMKFADSLKNLFNLFAGIFIENASELLRLTNLNEEPDGYFQGDQAVEKSSLLVDSIIATLNAVFLYDSHNFVNKERFTNLMKPLVDQIENKLGGEEVWMKRCEELITPCIAQMATSMSDDSLWKQLNHHVLLKTRHQDYMIRLVSVRTMCALTRKLGEDFLPLLPETVPFLAELLEDDVEEVEKECQRVVNDMEEILGEPIQKYF
uniref:HEAT repeat-containing protein 1 n=1 Tax=Lygus hesperus TaxID=30085 RepID=A0A146KUJ9_LYGHE